MTSDPTRHENFTNARRDRATLSEKEARILRIVESIERAGGVAADSSVSLGIVAKRARTTTTVVRKFLERIGKVHVVETPSPSTLQAKKDKYKNQKYRGR